MTNSPPAKVKQANYAQVYKILASGVDTLVLSFKVEWIKEDLFSQLDKMKQVAQERKQEFSTCLPFRENGTGWVFNMLPNGSKGYQWILSGHDYTMKIGQWLTDISRPNIMAEVRSETLWRLGLEDALSCLVEIIEGIGGQITECKLSRVDLCVDLLLPEDLWTATIAEHAITYASNKDIHMMHRKLTGLSIGSGEIQARLYDKALEIKQKSKKFWMFDVWGIEEVPEGMKAVRVEFQARREFLKEVKMNTVEDLLKGSHEMWAYCTQKWLKFQDRPERHHTMRKNLPFWDHIQDGYRGYQNSTPAVREAVKDTDTQMRVMQAMGSIVSLQAIEMEHRGAAVDSPVTYADCVDQFMRHPQMMEYLQKPVDKDRFMKKRAKYHRVLKDTGKHLKYSVATEPEEEGS